MNPPDVAPALARTLESAARRIALPLVAAGAALVLLASIAAGRCLEGRVLAAAAARAATILAQLQARGPGLLPTLDASTQVALLDAAGTRVLDASDPALRGASSPALAPVARAGFDGRYWAARGRFRTRRGEIAHYWLRLDLAAALHEIAVRQLIVTLGGIACVLAAVALLRRRLRRDWLPRLQALADALAGRTPSAREAGDDVLDALTEAAVALHAALAESRRRADALQARTARLALRERAWLERLPIALLLVRDDGTLLDANAAASRLLGLDSGVPPALAALLPAVRPAACSAGVETVAQVRGVEVPVTVRAVRAPAQAGDDEETWCLVLDDRRAGVRTAAALAASERRLAALAASGGFTLWEYEATQSAEAPASPFAHCHPEDLAGVHAALADHLAGRTPRVEVEFRGADADGTWRWWRAQGQAVADADEADGPSRRVLGVLREVTAERDALAALARTRDEALRATQAKSRFLANMSHELRTPLNGVLGMLSLLERERLSEEQRAFVEVAVKSGRTLFELIDDVLDFSKIEAGALQLERTACALRAVAEDALDMLAERAHQRGIDLVLRWDARVPRRVETDPARLRQVLLNLLDNGIKFTERGHVMLALAPATSGGIRFEIVDTGIGIPRERQQAIFEPFCQADDSTTRRYGGTGLGLGITRQLVELLGGRLELESEPGRGSRFVFELPLAEIADEEGPRPPALSGLRILLQEPAAVVAEAGAALLRDHGAGVEVVRDQRELTAALAAAKAPPDLAILAASGDLQARGQEIAKMRELPQGAGLPMIAMLPFGRRTGTDELRVLGVQGLLTKPLREAHVLRILGDVLAPDAMAALAMTLSRARPPGAETRADRAALKVLVVDDVVTNLKVAAGMLAKLGIAAQLVESGRAALDAVASTEFDLVFMDCQMPGMDGFETTALIRARYLPDEGPRIVAMTANAASTDRDRCLAHGMDDYLAKPVLLSDLERVLHRWSRVPDAGQAARPDRAPAPLMEAAIDRRKLQDLATLLGTAEFDALCARFRRDGRQQIERLAFALSGGDLAAARGAAHALKGAAANVGAARLAALCRDAGTAGDDELRRMLPALESGFDEFCAALEDYAAVTA
ncbi:MAG TPA: ATP-binding protein [Gammaproteobacteria bacterium]|nr:ATP-binding protein [Gammaproteobacteria bacterium]